MKLVTVSDLPSSRWLSVPLSSRSRDESPESTVGRFLLEFFLKCLMGCDMALVEFNDWKASGESL